MQKQGILSKIIIFQHFFYQTRNDTDDTKYLLSSNDIDDIKTVLSITKENIMRKSSLTLNDLINLKTIKRMMRPYYNITTNMSKV